MHRVRSLPDWIFLNKFLQYTEVTVNACIHLVLAVFLIRGTALKLLPQIHTQTEHRLWQILLEIV